MNTAGQSSVLEDLAHVKRLISRGNALIRDSTPADLVTIVEIEGGFIVKYGMGVFRSESIAMELVRSRTNIPVPLVYAYLTEGSEERRRGYIVMEKIKGTTLRSVLQTMDEAAWKSVINELTEYVSELHRIDGKEWGMVGKKGTFHLGHFMYESGPLQTTSTAGFVDYFVKAARRDMEDSKIKALVKNINLTRAPVFSHGDLVPDNIMVDPSTGTVTGIIDWEFAGWYPYFWDYYIAWRYSPALVYWVNFYKIALESCEDAAKSFSKIYNDAEADGTYSMEC